MERLLDESERKKEREVWWRKERGPAAVRQLSVKKQYPIYYKCPKAFSSSKILLAMK
jgi:hypothetical protein